MLRTFFTWFSVLLLTTALAACCGSTACECDDQFADAISLQFSPDTTGTNPTGFRARQVSTVYLVRVPRDTAQRPRADTVQVVRPAAQAARPIILNNTTPFAQAGNRKLDSYFYRLYLAAGPTLPHTFDLAIDSIRLNTDFRADGCCTCFENTNKQVYLNGNRTPRDLTSTEVRNGLVPLTITR